MLQLGAILQEVLQLICMIETYMKEFLTKKYWNEQKSDSQLDWQYKKPIHVTNKQPQRLLPHQCLVD